MPTGETVILTPRRDTGRGSRHQVTREETPEENSADEESEE